MASRGSQPQRQSRRVVTSEAPAAGLGRLQVRPEIWPDVCVRLQCPKDTPVVVLNMADLKAQQHDRVMGELSRIGRLVVVMPDRQSSGVWQMLYNFTVKRYFYRPHTRLVGVEGWSHWALLVDFSKDMQQSDDLIKPEREYSREELEGKYQRTSSARRRYRRRMLSGDYQGGPPSGAPM